MVVSGGMLVTYDKSTWGIQIVDMLVVHVHVGCHAVLIKVYTLAAGMGILRSS